MPSGIEESLGRVVFITKIVLTSEWRELSALASYWQADKVKSCCLQDMVRIILQAYHLHSNIDNEVSCCIAVYCYLKFRARMIRIPPFKEKVIPDPTLTKMLWISELFFFVNGLYAC